MTDIDIEDDDWTEYESGPFCRHWYDPSDCEILCATCGHRCCRHGYGDGCGCEEDGCACSDWKEPAE